jgi:hypothetical protein
MVTLGIYLLPFLALALLVRRWLRGKATSLADTRSQGMPTDRQGRFLLGIWRRDD